MEKCQADSKKSKQPEEVLLDKGHGDLKECPINMGRRRDAG
jgi:hypothetical protein